MPVKMVEEGNTYLSTSATEEQKEEVLKNAFDLMDEMRDKGLNFFVGVFKDDGVVLAGRGTPHQMILLAESLVDKADRTNREVDLLDLLKTFFDKHS